MFKNVFMKKKKQIEEEENGTDKTVENENSAQISSNESDENGISEEFSENNSETTEQDEKSEVLYKLAEMNDKFLRLHSEFDNYRKRTIKEKNELSKYANSELITELLPVIDDFERALKSMQKNAETEPSIQGIELIYNKLLKILEKQGLKAVKSVGEPFNTDFHEAVTKVPVEDEALKGKVFDEIQKGYELDEKVIRYAKVMVAE